MLQTTIKQRISCEDTGLHSGKTVSLTLRPAPENTGIVFHISTEKGSRVITASPDAVIATSLATTLGSDGVTVSTVEHLLAALRGLEIDNVHIDVSGGEIPILDGSAAAFVDLINKAGIMTQFKPRKVLRFTEPVSFVQGEKSIKAEPYRGFRVEYTIDFPHPAIGRQHRALELSPVSFAQVAKARTFGFLKDVEALQSRGMALGGSLDNAVVLDEKGVINPEGLRYVDEFVRHKILDFVGDMAMLPLPLQGRFTVTRSGHALNNEFLRHCLQESILRVEDASPETRVAKPKKERHTARAPLGMPAFAG